MCLQKRIPVSPFFLTNSVCFQTIYKRNRSRTPHPKDPAPALWVDLMPCLRVFFATVREQPVLQTMLRQKIQHANGCFCRLFRDLGTDAGTQCTSRAAKISKAQKHPQNIHCCTNKITNNTIHKHIHKHIHKSVHKKDSQARLQTYSRKHP